MASAPQTTTTSISAEAFEQRPDPGYPEELVNGKVVAMPPAGARHGKICSQISRLLGNHVEQTDCGHVLTNDTGVVTTRSPDSVRGPDVSFYSYARLPKGPVPEGFPGVAPDVVFEVLSPQDRWPRILAKVAEYLAAEVRAVVVIDPERRMAHVYEGDEPVRIVSVSDELALPELLGEFRVALDRLLD